MCPTENLIFTWAPNLELYHACAQQLSFRLIGLGVLVRTLFRLGTLVRNLFRFDVLIDFLTMRISQNLVLI